MSTPFRRRSLLAASMACLVLGSALPAAAFAVIPCDQNQAPIIGGFMNPATIIENNHKYVPVSAVIVSADDDSGPLTYDLVSAVSSDPDDGMGQGDKPDDVVQVSFYDFLVRAELGKGASSRSYTFTYRITDGCGVSAATSVTVTVEARR